jgi:hypothetical protein
MAKGKPIRPVGRRLVEIDISPGSASRARFERDGFSKIHRPNKKLDVPEIKRIEEKPKKPIKKQTLFDIIDIDD